MSAPVVDSVVASVANPTPGSALDVTVTAHDADARTVVVTIPVQDLAGNATQAVQSIVVGDPITFGPATVADPAGVATVTQDATNPAVFHVTV